MDNNMRRLIAILILLLLTATAYAQIVLIDDIAPKNEAFNVMVDISRVGDATPAADLSMDANDDKVIDYWFLSDTTTGWTTFNTLYKGNAVQWDSAYVTTRYVKDSISGGGGGWPWWDSSGNNIPGVVDSADGGAIRSETSKVADSANQLLHDYIRDWHFANDDWGDMSVATNVVTLDADVVSANELNATGVEAELEAVMDLQDMQGAVTDAQVPNDITVDLATSATTSDSALAMHDGGLDSADFHVEVRHFIADVIRDTGFLETGDNLGDHTATQDIELGSFSLDGDGASDAALSLDISNNDTTDFIFYSKYYSGLQAPTKRKKMLSFDNTGFMGFGAWYNSTRYHFDIEADSIFFISKLGGPLFGQPAVVAWNESDSNRSDYVGWKAPANVTTSWVGEFPAAPPGVASSVPIFTTGAVWSWGGLSDIQGAVTDAQVPDDITIDLATTADSALAMHDGGLDSADFANEVRHFIADVIRDTGFLETGDNLGNHTATQNLNMAGFEIANLSGTDLIDLDLDGTSHPEISFSEVSDDDLRFKFLLDARTDSIMLSAHTTGASPQNALRIDGLDSLILQPVISGRSSVLRLNNDSGDGVSLYVPNSGVTSYGVILPDSLPKDDHRTLTSNSSGTLEWTPSTEMKAVTVHLPHQVKDTTDHLTLFRVDDLIAPSGISILQFGIETLDSSYTLILEKWSSLADASPDQVDTVSTSSDNTAESVPNPSNDEVAAGELLRIELPTDVTDQLHAYIIYYRLPDGS